MIDLREIYAKIEADKRREANGRDCLDYLIPGRIAAAMERERNRAINGKRRPIQHVGEVVSDPPAFSDYAKRVETRWSARDNKRLIDSGQSAYDAVCANLTGESIPETAFQTGRLRRFAQDQKSIELAQALDSTGRFPDKKFYFGPNHPDSVTVIGLETGAVLPLPAVRRVNFLPSVAAANRAKMLRDVEHFISCHPGRCRMYTFTRGPRIPIHRTGLRKEWSRFGRRLSKLAHKLRKKWGVSIEWAGNELGEPKWVNGALTVHLHAHTLVLEPEDMNPKKRARIRKAIWRLMTDPTTGEKRMWDDAGEIQNAREFVKYPVKDADLDVILREGGPGVLADLYEAVRGMRVCRPMSHLRAIRSTRRKATLPRRITAIKTHDGRTLVETADWNANKRPLAGRNREREEFRKRANALAARQACAEIGRLIGSGAADFADETAETGRLNGPLYPKTADGEENDPRETEDDFGPRGPQLGEEKAGRKAAAPVNRVIARLAPAPYGGPICEPAVVVWGFNGDVSAVLAQPQVAAIRAKHSDAYRMAAAVELALARNIRAHAHAAHAHAASQGSQGSNNCPTPLFRETAAEPENRPADPPETPTWAEIEAFEP